MNSNWHISNNNTKEQLLHNISAEKNKLKTAAFTQFLGHLLRDDQINPVKMSSVRTK